MLRGGGSFNRPEVFLHQSLQAELLNPLLEILSQAVFQIHQKSSTGTTEIYGNTLQLLLNHLLEILNQVVFQIHLSHLQEILNLNQTTTHHRLAVMIVELRDHFYQYLYLYHGVITTAIMDLVMDMAVIVL